MSLYKIQRSNRHKKRHKIYMDAAVLEAHKSSMLHQHGAVIVKHGHIIGRGHNYRTFQDHHNYGSKSSVHAEIDALNSVSNHRRHLKGATMYVMRLLSNSDEDDILGNSMPCPECMIKINRFMTKYGLRSVYYSDNT